MTEPTAPEPPEGYTFISGDMANPTWIDVGSQQFYWDAYEQDFPHVVFIHAECGAFVVGGMIAIHDAWHATLTPPE